MLNFEWTQVAAVAEIENKQRLKIEFLGEKYLIAQTERKEWIAFSMYCPHVGAIMTNAEVRHGKIVCPFHNWEFQVHTGQCLFPNHGPQIACLQVKEEDGLLFVKK